MCFGPAFSRAWVSDTEELPSEGLYTDGNRPAACATMPGQKTGGKSYRGNSVDHLSPTKRLRIVPSEVVS